MPNPGNFRGKRLAFLDGQAKAYAEGIRNNQLADMVADIQCRDFKRFPMSLSPDQEPTQEWLDAVDDSAPEPELAVPNPDSMEHDAYTAATEEYEKLVSKTRALKDTIKRRLAYVHSKARSKEGSVDWKKTKLDDPLSVLVAKLAGADLKVPRIRTPYNIWGPLHRSFCDPIVEQRIKERNIPAAQHLAVCSAVYKEQFELLPAEEKDTWAKKATEEHEKALDGLKEMKEKAGSRTPEDYQRVISAIPSILEPILELISQYTGWNWSAFGGGPEPADGGRLNMICIHSGLTAGSRLDFGRSECDAMKKHILPAFGRFTKKSFGKDVCRACALPQDHNMSCLADLPEEERRDIGLHQCDDQPADSSKKLRAFEVELATLPKSVPTTGTPSPPVRFGPPLAKKKDRLLPTKDNPESLRPGPRVYTPSPLSQPPITAQQLSYKPDLDTTNNNADPSATGVPTAFTVPAGVNSQFTGNTITNSKPSEPASAPTPDNATSQDGNHDSPAAAQMNTATSSNTSLDSSINGIPSVMAHVALDGSHNHSQSHSLTPEPEMNRSPPPSLPPSPTKSRTGSPEAPDAQSALETSTFTPPLMSQPETAPPEHSRKVLGSLNGVAIIPTLHQLLKLKSMATPPGSATVPVLNENGTNFVDKIAPIATTSPTNKRKEAAGGSSGAPSKKQRFGSAGASSTARAFKITEPTNCPDWVSNALSLLTAQDFSETWRHLVELWLAIEAKHGFNIQGNKKLASRGRPAEVAAWIKRARSPVFRPEVKLAQFEEAYTSWWREVQPKWRLSNGGGALEQGDGEWGDIECTGVNGLLSVVAALFFWGFGIPTGDGTLDAWNNAVQDAVYVFQQLA